jgi:hypothetical protein
VEGTDTRSNTQLVRVPPLTVAALLLIAIASRVEGETQRFPYEAGRTIGVAEVEALREWFPPPFWGHRNLVFHEGMVMEIGRAHRDYSPPQVYAAATERHRGEASIGPEGTLAGYTAGRPFPADAVDCRQDPQAGPKWIWNFVHRWQGFGAQAHFRYTYWERGEQRPLLYQGRSSAWLLKHRPEGLFEGQRGDVLPGEKRAAAVRLEVEKPDELAGTRTLTFRYEASYGPPASAKLEDTWIYSPEIRRTRKITERQRHSAFAGTDFTFDDLFSFSGLPAQYRWRCLGESEVLAPMNTRVRGHPLGEDGRFGASGLSYASDRWELRRAVILEMVPKDADHPYAKKELWIDGETAQPLYAFAYDTTDALWKIIYHNHRWSEDELDGIAPREWYPGWEEVPKPRDLRVVSDAILNVQTGTGNRIEFWDSQGTRPDPKRLRRQLSPTRLSR